MWRPGVIFKAMATKDSKTLFARAQQVLAEARAAHRVRLFKFVEDEVLSNARQCQPIFRITPVAEFGFTEIDEVLRAQGLPYAVEWRYEEGSQMSLRRFVINLEGVATAGM